MEDYRIRTNNLLSVLEASPQREAYGRDNHHHNGVKQTKLQGVNGANRHQWG